MASTDIFLSAKSGDFSAVRAYVETQGDLNVLDEDGFNLLMVALQSHQEEVACYLLTSGINLLSDEEEGPEPLHIALKQRMWKTAAIILEKGGFSTLTDEFGELPLTLAMEEYDTTALLLSYGADPYALDAEEESPYDHAKRDLKVDIIKLYASYDK